ncbi:EAL domain-containing protein, partial [Pseudomonas reactans]
SIIAMAHSLRLKVVAEGIETDSQLGFLVQRGCDYAQGYLISRPLPAGPIADLLSSGGRSALHPVAPDDAERTLL